MSVRKRCDTCRYWSAMVAESRPAGVFALCLGPGRTPRRWTGGATEGCAQWAEATLGPVDAPGLHPDRYEEPL